MATTTRSRAEPLSDRVHPAAHEMIDVRLSWHNGPGATRTADFEILMDDVIGLLLDGKLVKRKRELEPSPRLRGALIEAQAAKPRFKTAEELFDALEAEGR